MNRPPKVLKTLWYIILIFFLFLFHCAITFFLFWYRKLMWSKLTKPTWVDRVYRVFGECNPNWWVGQRMSTKYSGLTNWWFHPFTKWTSKVKNKPSEGWVWLKYDWILLKSNGNWIWLLKPFSTQHFFLNTSKYHLFIYNISFTIQIHIFIISSFYSVFTISSKLSHNSRNLFCDVF